MELKSKSQNTTSTGEKTVVKITGYQAAQVKLPEMLVEELVDLLNHGSLFADHCRLTLSIDGPHSVRVKNTIMNDAEFDASNPFDEIISGTFIDTDVKYLDIVLSDLTDPLRIALGSTIIDYLHSIREESQSNTTQSISDLIKKHIKF